MKNILYPVLLVLMLGIQGCSQEDIKLYLNSFDPNTFYTEEIIPEGYLGIYGQWKLESIGGGFAGTGFEPNHDFLEIRRIGIYGIIRNDSLIEYGKIQPDTFDTRTIEFLQVRLLPESSDEPFISPPEKYINLEGSDKMVLRSPCCDMYDYYYSRRR